MAVTTGLNGLVTIAPSTGGDAVLNVFQWSASGERDIYESTEFGVLSLGKEHAAGMYVWTISLSGYLDGTTLFDESFFKPEGATGTFELSASAANIYSGVGLISNWTPTVHRQTGLNAYTCTITSIGNILINDTGG